VKSFALALFLYQSGVADAKECGMQDFKRLRLADGYALVELLLVLTIAAVVLAIAIPRGVSSLDRVSVASASADVQATLNYARLLAIAGGSAVAIDVDSARGELRVRRGAELVMSRNVGEAHAVTMWGSRDSLTYDARGLGRGAANLSIIVQRRSAVETVFVSRLGRIR
jgi:prepilin-type N-terminal cleavage/methylation domain-containing protein